jgi:hypothetical protein
MSEVAWWVVDYDLPVENMAKRRAFYRALHKILASHDVEADRSTQSVWILDDRGIAGEIHGLASKFGRSHLYEAKRVD